MARYEAGALIFTERCELVEPGCIFSSDGVPGKNWIPVDEEAHERVSRLLSRPAAPDPEPAPVPAAPAPAQEPPQADASVAIPSGWRTLPPLQLFNLGRKLFGSSLTPPEGVSRGDYIRSLIADEAARRDASAATDGDHHG